MIGAKDGHINHLLCLQDKSYAFFGTCLGAIIAYEICHLVESEKIAPAPLAFFPAAVSPPHLYSLAVMKLYMTRVIEADEPPPIEEVTQKLRGWKELPKETVMLVRHGRLTAHCIISTFGNATSRALM